MTKDTKKKKKLKKSHRSRTTVALFWISLILVVVPVGIFGYILLSAKMDTGTPVLGNRYEGDLDPAIKKDEIAQIDTLVKSIDGVQDEFSNLASATLRIYAQMDGAATAEDATAMCSTIYESISTILDPSVYFTQTDGKKMYDLEIHVYNCDPAQAGENEGYVYVVDTKTSSMSEPRAQVVSQAVSPELAEQLRQDVIDRKAAEEAEAAAKAAAEAESQATDAPTETEMPEENQ